MIDDELQTQAALYSLDALPADEAAAFAARLAEDPALAALVAEYEAAASAIAQAAPPATPPAHLRENILAALAPPHAATEARRVAWLPWALAAGFAFATGTLWVQNGHLRTLTHGQLAAWTELSAELQASQTRDAEKAAALAAMGAQLAQLRETDAGKAARIASLQATITDLEQRNAHAEMEVATLTSKLDTSYLASIAWDKNKQEGVLHVRRLPATGSDKDYQLWVIDPKYSAPISAGVFKVQPDGSATITFAPEQRITDVTAFAVTLERAGGAPKAEGPVMLSN